MLTLREEWESLCRSRFRVIAAHTVSTMWAIIGSIDTLVSKCKKSIKLQLSRQCSLSHSLCFSLQILLLTRKYIMMPHVVAIKSIPKLHHAITDTFLMTARRLLPHLKPSHWIITSQHGTLKVWCAKVVGFTVKVKYIMWDRMHYPTAGAKLGALKGRLSMCTTLDDNIALCVGPYGIISRHPWDVISHISTRAIFYNKMMTQSLDHPSPSPLFSSCTTWEASTTAWYHLNTTRYACTSR